MGKRGGQDGREASPNCFHDLLCVVTKKENRGRGAPPDSNAEANGLWGQERLIFQTPSVSALSAPSSPGALAAPCREWGVGGGCAAFRRQRACYAVCLGNRFPSRPGWKRSLSQLPLWPYDGEGGWADAGGGPALMGVCLDKISGSDPPHPLAQCGVPTSPLSSQPFCSG